MCSGSDIVGCWVSPTQLMHHYTDAAYRTLSFSSEVFATLRSEVPKEAFSHPFLLHEILAFAGFHMAFSCPERRHEYLLQASHHQSLAIEGTRKALGAMDADNCHALYATSLFVIINAFAAYPICEMSHKCANPIDTIVDIFTLVNGTGTIIRSWENTIRNGRLKGLFLQCADDGTSFSDLTLLLQQVSALRGKVLNTENLGDEQAAIIASSIDALEACVVIASRSRMLGAPAELRAVFIWPMFMSPGYLDMVRNHQLPALAVLAHYTVLICMAESRCWFLQDWGQTLLHTLANELEKSFWEESIVWLRDFTTILSATRR